MIKDKKIEFTYNGMKCEVSKIENNFTVLVFNEKGFVIDRKDLFPSKKYSDRQLEIAYDIANMHILKDLITE